MSDIAAINNAVGKTKDIDKSKAMGNG